MGGDNVEVVRDGAAVGEEFADLFLALGGLGGGEQAVAALQHAVDVFQNGGHAFIQLGGDFLQVAGGGCEFQQHGFARTGEIAEVDRAFAEENLFVIER